MFGAQTGFGPFGVKGLADDAVVSVVAVLVLLLSVVLAVLVLLLQAVKEKPAIAIAKTDEQSLALPVFKLKSDVAENFINN